MDWTEMSEMSSPNSGKRTSYERSGSKDSMQVQSDEKVSAHLPILALKWPFLKGQKST